MGKNATFAAQKPTVKIFPKQNTVAKNKDGCDNADRLCESSVAFSSVFIAAQPPPFYISDSLRLGRPRLRLPLSCPLRRSLPPAITIFYVRALERNYMGLVCVFSVA